MRRILLSVFFVLCAVGRAAFSNVPESIDIKWMVDGNLYSQSTCEYGGNVILPDAPTKRGHTFVGWRRNYVELEYLESTGTQYIDTGVILTQDSDIFLSFVFYGGSGIFGSREGANENNIEVAYLNGGMTADFTNSSYGAYRLFVSGLVGEKIDCVLNKELRSFNDVVIYKRCEDKISTIKNAYLFAVSGKPSNAELMAGVVYYCKIYNDDVLVRDFIPVLDEDGVPCMYDRVTNEFFYNQGTGQFIAGPIKS